MTDNKSKISPQEVANWVQSVVDYIKDNQATRLDLRAVPVNPLIPPSNQENRQVSVELIVDILPILTALAGSSITELNLLSSSVSYKVQNVADILARTNVAKLSLSHKYLGSHDFFDLIKALEGTQVTELILSGSGAVLEGEKFDNIIALIGKSSLKSLTLSNVLMKSLEKVSLLFNILPKTQLTSLDLSGAFFFLHASENFPALLEALMLSLPRTEITDLSLSSNKLSDASARIIGAGLQNSKLEKLNLSHNDLTAVGVFALVPGLTCSQITHLNVGHNRMYAAFDVLGHCLKDTKIKELFLSGDPHHTERMHYQYLIDMLSRFSVEPVINPNAETMRRVTPLSLREVESSSLTYLDISSTNLNLDKFLAVVEFLTSSAVTHIDFSKNRLPDQSLSILSDCLAKTRLKYIDLGATGISNESTAVASFLTSTIGSTIVSLNLSNNGLSQLNLTNTTFHELNLSHNRFVVEISSLAEQLKLSAITALCLNSNEIGDTGATVLANCLEETQVVKLQLKKNGITSVGAKALALVLRKTKLRRLDLESNKIEDDGAEFLADYAENSCCTYLNVSYNPGTRKLVVDRVLWENRRKILHFADLLKRTALFTGDSNVFEFDRDFDDINMDVFIGDCLKLYKMVLEEPFIIATIEQDRRILDFEESKLCHSEYPDEVYIENCELIFQKIVEQSSPIQRTVEEKNVSFFKKQFLWLMLEYFPTKFVSFIGGRIEADLDQHIALLRKLEDLELPRIVELLLLNRPIYLIDQEQEILHPYVYKLLFKYKQTICNTEIEPEGVEKIIEFFKKNIKMKYASEVICLLNISKLQQM